MKNKKTVDTIFNLFFILIDSMFFLLRIKHTKTIDLLKNIGYICKFMVCLH